LLAATVVVVVVVVVVVAAAAAAVTIVALARTEKNQNSIEPKWKLLSVALTCFLLLAH